MASNLCKRRKEDIIPLRPVKAVRKSWVYDPILRHMIRDSIWIGRSRKRIANTIFCLRVVGMRKSGETSRERCLILMMTRMPNWIGIDLFTKPKMTVTSLLSMMKLTRRSYRRGISFSDNQRIYSQYLDCYRNLCKDWMLSITRMSSLLWASRVVGRARCSTLCCWVTTALRK